MSDQKNRTLEELRELRDEHERALANDGPITEFAQAEQVTRNSYDLVLHEALDDGTITTDDLSAKGLPCKLD